MKKMNGKFGEKKKQLPCMTESYQPHKCAMNEVAFPSHMSDWGEKKKYTGTKCMYIIVGWGMEGWDFKEQFSRYQHFLTFCTGKWILFGDGEEKMNIKLNKWIKKMFFCTYAERMVRKARLSFPIHIHDFDDMYMAQKFIHMAFYAYCLFCCFVWWENSLFLLFLAFFLLAS